MKKIFLTIIPIILAVFLTIYICNKICINNQIIKDKNKIITNYKVLLNELVRNKDFSKDEVLQRFESEFYIESILQDTAKTYFIIKPRFDSIDMGISEFYGLELVFDKENKLQLIQQHKP